MIYFVTYHPFKYIKIGTTEDLSRRLNEIKSVNPTARVKAVIPGSYQTERGLHEMFSKQHYRGEWFKFSRELRWFVLAIQDNPGINNIRELYVISTQKYLKNKSKRLGKDHKLSQNIAKFGSQK